MPTVNDRRAGRRQPMDAAGFALLCLLLATIPGRPGDQPTVAQQSHGIVVPNAIIPKIIDTGHLGDGRGVGGDVEGSNGSGGGPTSPPVNVYAAYSSEPAPIGVADYGVGPHGAYDYSTNSTIGSVSMTSLSATNATSSPWVSFQLNENLQFYNAGKPYVYWVQDVAILDTATNYVYFVNNIWNSSSVTATISKADISGGGQVYGNGTHAYYAVAASAFLRGNLIRLPYPAVIEFRLNSSFTSTGQPEVTFEYNDGYGWEHFDTAVFSSVHSLSALRGFVVDGFAYKPTGFYDSELVMGGPGGGSKTSDVSSDLSMQLEYWNGNNYQLVTDAYNFGSDTAEGIQNAVSQWSYDPADGAITATVRSGAGSLGQLWDESGVGTLEVASSIASGILEVRAVPSAASPTAVADYPFVGDEVTVTLQPGYYSVYIYNGTVLSSSGNYSMTAGQVLHLHTPLGSIFLTLSYSVVGGGSGYSPPVLTYVVGGVTHAAPLSTTPTVFDLDPGSAWSVSSLLSGSGATERWETAQPTTGVASSSSVVSLTYYHQYLEDITYSVLGGGSGYSPPSLSGPQLGVASFLALGSSPTSYWLDNGLAYSATNPLPGSTSTERWFALSNQSIVAGSGLSVSIAYTHQYYLAMKGADSPSQWYDSGAQVVVSQPIAYDRAQGFGQRLTSYTLDSGLPVAIAPSPGNVTVPVSMDSPHVLSFSSVTQFELTLDPIVTKALGSLTPPPAIPGDGYWYDSGSNVSVVLDGVWGRSSGVGTRLVSYAVNGGPSVRVGTTGSVTIGVAGIAAPQSISGESATQYLLAIPDDAGSLVSVTPPSIQGDTGWYDNGTTVDATFLYSWGFADGGQSRMNALGYSVSGTPASVALPREGNGTFSVSADMDQARSMAIESGSQYLFTYAGGSDVKLSSPSPTHDGFYDANSTLTVSSAYQVGSSSSSSSDRTRAVLDGYTLDSVDHPISLDRQEPANYTTPPILIDAPHSLTFDSVEQYLITFVVADSSGRVPLAPAPSSLTVDEADALGQQDALGLDVWMDNGTAFSISSIMWEGVNVAPTVSSVYRATSALSIPVDARVYDITLKVTDYLSHPVQGAKAEFVLANGTHVSERTDSAGSVVVGPVPLGTFNATVVSLGFTNHLTGSNATDGSPIIVRTYGSYLTFGVISIPIAVVIATLVALFTVRNLSQRRRRWPLRWGDDDRGVRGQGRQLTDLPAGASASSGHETRRGPTRIFAGRALREHPIRPIGPFRLRP
jgi:Thermopsin